MDSKRWSTVLARYPATAGLTPYIVSPAKPSQAEPPGRTEFNKGSLTFYWGKAAAHTNKNDKQTKMLSQISIMKLNIHKEPWQITQGTRWPIQSALNFGAFLGHQCQLPAPTGHDNPTKWDQGHLELHSNADRPCKVTFIHDRLISPWFLHQQQCDTYRVNPDGARGYTPI